jgi:hypothetical protein
MKLATLAENSKMQSCIYIWAFIVVVLDVQLGLCIKEVEELIDDVRIPQPFTKASKPTLFLWFGPLNL